MAQGQIISKKDMETLNIANLSDDKKEKLLSVKDSIDLNDISLLTYGDSISKELDTASTDLLSKVKLDQTPEIMDLLMELNSNMSQIDTGSLSKKKPGFLQKLFHTNDIENIIRRHDTILPIVENTKTKLKETQGQLQKDIEQCRIQYNEGLHRCEEMDCYILAGRLKIKEAEEELRAMEENLDTSDQFAVEEVSSLRGNIELLARKVDNLVVLRELAFQDIKKIKILAEADMANINNIQTSITTTIPAWESQMVIAVLISRAKTASDMQTAVTDMTNKLIEQNTAYLTATAIDIKKAVERGVIDYEVLQQSDKKMEEMTVELMKIGKESAEQRKKAIAALEETRAKRAALLGVMGETKGITQK